MRCAGSIPEGSYVRTAPYRRPMQARSQQACGFSNSAAAKSRRRIYREPCDNVPRKVRAGLNSVLDGAVNVRNRRVVIRLR
jgi:hypothetical protein